MTNHVPAPPPTEPGGPSPSPSQEEEEEEEVLYAICGRRSVYELKLVLKRASIFQPELPIIHDRRTGQTKIPTKLIRQPTKTTTMSTGKEGTEEEARPVSVDDPALVGLLPPTLISSARDLLAGFQWIIPSSSVSDHDSPKRAPSRPLRASASPLQRVIQTFFAPQLTHTLLPQLPKWELYDDFLLFQPNAFLAPSFSALLPQDDPHIRATFFAAIAAEFRVSHVARKGLISRDDVSRQPRLDPLHGTFIRSMASTDARGSPSFEEVFWTGTRFPTAQGAIHYVWAPSETMYSRGNSPEKRRIAGLSNVAGSVVVDMCCGIGFFAFGYLLAGAAQVLGCEISPWAVEGLRRGAILNKVPYEIVDPNHDQLPTDLLDSTSARLVIFPGMNELALPIYRHRATHVNLGLLPSSVQFLPQAVQALRPQGGWLHVHGELAVGGGPSGRLLGAKLWADELVQLVLSLGRQSAKTVGIHWIKSIGPAKEHLVVELEVGTIKNN
ncbi:hypothetical protein PGT21_019693 [Puccinia graminis f. sp. tritici]|uniref:tRNA(Phe) (4-demethylwyosine(37)-C(7)) aminocarboxypropyltransferase n=1 Tax=Puccinia graminis f. sp. tritici TaxID=56615 RepID=A0A5B0LMX3_PUCGR|nr:hypothetical protein PGT21_019693 [Puccinia graminis f. sp. tritici]